MDAQTFAYINRLDAAGVPLLDALLATEEARTLSTFTLASLTTSARPVERIAAMNVLHDRALAERDGVHTLDAPTFAHYFDLSRRYEPTCSCGTALGQTRNYGVVQAKYADHLRAVGKLPA